MSFAVSCAGMRAGTGCNVTSGSAAFFVYKNQSKLAPRLKIAKNRRKKEKEKRELEREKSPPPPPPPDPPPKMLLVGYLQLKVKLV